MGIDKFTYRIATEIAPNPIIITDAHLHIIYFNPLVKEYFPGISEKTNLDNYFPENIVSRISEVIKSDSSYMSFTCNDFIRTSKENYICTISKFISNEAALFFISFQPEEIKSTKTSIFIIEPNRTKLPILEDTKEIIEFIENDFPISSVEKKIFMERINNFDGAIWIKGNDSKYKIVNNNFSRSLGAKANEIIDRKENEILPLQERYLYENIDNYIFSTRQAIIIEKRKKSGESDLYQNKWLLKYPIWDTRKKNISIISLGFEVETTEPVILSAPESKTPSLLNKISKSGLTDNMVENLITHLTEPIIIYDAENLNLLSCNKRALELYGYSGDELIDKSIVDLFDFEDVQSLLENVHKEENEFAEVGPVKHIKKDGKTFLVRIQSIKFIYENKNAILNILEDLSGNIITKKENVFPVNILDDFSDFVIQTDENGFITFVNKKVKEFLNYPDIQFDNRPIVSMVTDEDKDKLNLLYAEVIKNGVTDFAEIHLKNSNNEAIKTRVKAEANFSKTARTFSIIFLFVKVPADKEKFESEEKSNIMKKENALSISFLSDMFHELLTPVNVILGFVHEIIDSIEKPTEEQLESADIITQNQKMLLQILDAASQYAQLESGNYKSQTEEVTVKNLLNEIKSNLLPSLEDKEIILPENDLVIPADRVKLKVILFNILKYSFLSTNTEKLFVTERLEAGKLIIGISDKQSGISPELTEKLRIAFLTSEFANSTNYGFPEIVIKLTRKLIEILKASCSISTSNGNPSEFLISIPVKLEGDFSKTQIHEGEKEVIPSESITVAEIEDKIEKKENSEVQKIIEEEKISDIPLVIMKKEISETIEEEKREVKEQDIPKIKDTDKTLNLTGLSCFYLEDQFDSQLLISSQLKDLKRIEFATGLENALPILSKSEFDFIIMDIKLEGDFDGFDALKIIRKLPGYENIPVIAVTAYSLPTEHAKFLSAGFNAYLPKPFLRDDILNSLTKVL